MHSGDGVHGADTFMYAERSIAQDGAPKVLRRPDARGASIGSKTLSRRNSRDVDTCFEGKAYYFQSTETTI
jgi:hypothetical protein